MHRAFSFFDAIMALTQKARKHPGVQVVSDESFRSGFVTGHDFSYAKTGIKTSGLQAMSAESTSACFVTGHDFSRAEKGTKTSGLQPLPSWLMWECSIFASLRISTTISFFAGPSKFVNFSS